MAPFAPPVAAKAAPSSPGAAADPTPARNELTTRAGVPVPGLDSTGAGRYVAICKRFYVAPEPTFVRALNGDHEGRTHARTARFGKAKFG